MNQLARVVAALSSLTGASGCGSAEAPSQDRARERIVGLPCEGCEAVFESLPVTLETDARIGRQDEAGQSLRIVGTVFDPAGNPASGVIVYAYHTNSRGIYPPDDRYRGLAAYHHGLLRGWAMERLFVPHPVIGDLNFPEWIRFLYIQNRHHAHQLAVRMGWLERRDKAARRGGSRGRRG